MKMSTFMKATFISIIFLMSFEILISGSPRMVLVEEATQWNCPPCAYYNATYDPWAQANLDKVVPIAYHAWWPGTDNDPMYHSDVNNCKGRINYYSINGVPNAVVAGNAYSGAPEAATLTTKVNTVLAKGDSPYTITINEQVVADSSHITITVKCDNAVTNVKLRVCATEFEHHYDPAGTNGEKDFVFISRQMFPDHNGTTLNLTAGETKTFNFSYKKDASWNADKMYVTAFVQNDATKEVFQAASNLKLVKSTLETTKNYFTIPRSGNVEQNLTVTNPTNAPMTVDLTLDPELLTQLRNNLWDAEITPASLTLDPSASGTVKLKVTASNFSIFLPITVIATPRNDGSAIFVPSKQSFSFLASGTKYVLFDGTNNSSDKPFTTFTFLGTYTKDAAILPFNDDIFANYPLSSFDFAFFTFDYFNRGAFASGTSRFFTSLNEMITAGKKVLITGELELYNALSQYGSTEAKNFFTNTLKIATASDPTIRITTDANGQITGVVSYPMKGVTGDVIGDGIDYTMNQITSNYQFYDIFTDVIKLNSGSTSVPFLYYDNDVNKIAAVRYASGNSKIIFTTFGFEGIKDDTKRSDLMEKMMSWLMGNSNVFENISSSNDFMSVNVYPNPSKGDLHVSLNLLEETQVSDFRIINSLGQHVAFIQNGNMTTGTHTFDLNNLNLNSGDYFIYINSAKGKLQSHFTVVK